MAKLAISDDQGDLNLQATELCLGLPGSDRRGGPSHPNKRPFSEVLDKESHTNVSDAGTSLDHSSQPPPAKAQVVGWPPVRSYRKNCLAGKKNETESCIGGFVKVSMDGAPYLRKIDLTIYKSYTELINALESMFKFNIDGNSDYAQTYEDKDGDWMLVGDVPWEMFICCCKRLRIMKGSEARGLGCL